MLVTPRCRTGVRGPVPREGARHTIVIGPHDRRVLPNRRVGGEVATPVHGVPAPWTGVVSCLEVIDVAWRRVVPPPLRQLVKRLELGRRLAGLVHPPPRVNAAD